MQECQACGEGDCENCNCAHWCNCENCTPED